MKMVWTFDPPFPIQYFSSKNRKLFIAAEPNGDNDRPEKRDMGEWIRNVPKTGTKFYRYLVSIATTFSGGVIDLKSDFDPIGVLGEWRFIDLVSEEAGSSVEGDFRKRVRNNITNTLEIIMKDKPEAIVLLGSHSQSAFEEIISPHLLNTNFKRLGMPHPSSRVGGYISRDKVGDPNLMLRHVSQRMMSYSHVNGWKSF